MIKHLWLKNFGPFEHASVLFEDFTVILGANGTGKSLLLTALRALGRVAKFPLRYTGPGQHLGGYPTRTGQVSLADVLHRGDTTRTVTLGVEFEWPDVSGTYEVHLKHWQNAGGTIVEEQLNARTKAGDLKVFAHADGSVESTLTIPQGQLRTPRFRSIPVSMFQSHDANEKALGEQIQQALWDRIGVFRFDPTALKAPAPVGRTLSPTGYGFATYLDAIRNEPGGKAEFDALLDRFRKVCPHVEDILLPFDGQVGSQSARKRIALAMAAAPRKTIPIDLESDGTILLLAYASLLHGSRPHDTICIEEPENGVHPKAIPQQVQMLRELTKAHGERPGAQVLCCTHSRAFLEEMKNVPEKLRLVRRGGDGRSSVETVPPHLLPVVAGWAGLT